MTSSATQATAELPFSEPWGVLPKAAPPHAPGRMVYNDNALRGLARRISGEHHELRSLQDRHMDAIWIYFRAACLWTEHRLATDQ
jgi:hypothetical protein